MAFRLPTRTIVQPGALGRLTDVLATLASGDVAVVTDPGVVAAGWADRVTEMTARAGRRAILLADVEANPRVETVNRMAEVARAARCTCVVAVGGGSAIDAAKGVALLLTNPGSCRDYEGRNRFAYPSAPLVAIPTTCGTGSEVTWVSVLSLAQEQRKISVKGDGMFPTWALVDADVLTTAPPGIVASTGMDALTHAVEATLATVSNPVSDALAETAIRLLVAFLPRAVANPSGDEEARREVMRASTLAGMAFGNADVGAVHCLSESLGGVFDLPHGLLNAMLLVPVVRAHGTAAHPVLARIERNMDPASDTSDADAAEAFLDRLDGLGRATGIPPFDSLQVSTEPFDRIADLAERNGSNGSNPRVWHAGDYRAVLDGLI